MLRAYICHICRISGEHHLLRRCYSGAASKPIANIFNYQEVEQGWYEKWEKQGHFKGPKNVDKSTFRLLLPPPNVTGTLHIGHALTGSIQDALARWHRMNGRDVLWVPGLDHAGIATQVVVERHLEANKLGTRHSLGRDAFLKESWKWKESKGDFILQQLRDLGCSLDWNKEYFTLDEERSQAVVEAFVQLYERDLIFRTEALVNWSCQLQSTIADIEVDWMQLEQPTLVSVPGYDEKIKFGELTHVALPVLGEKSELIVATTRLETMVGDTAIAVHPNDERYSSFIGKFVKHPLRPEAKIPVVADEFVDPKFGTGAVKITPAHDATDFEVGRRHELEIVSVFSNDGMILPVGKQFSGMKRFTAREEIRKYLFSLGLIRGVSAVPNSKIPICSRSGDVIELMLKPQWFVNCKGMAQKAVSALESGELVIEPAAFHKDWYHWLGNVKDWCLSRQLWWGHRVPAYLCKCTETGQETWVAAESEARAREKASKKLNSKNLVVTQDPDVLDTWFSSGLLPFAAFGWPKDSNDFRHHYPLSLMETGHDIIFFWVARMVMLGMELTGELPFKRVLLHGLVCDSRGRKMSKSLGNVISPEDMVHGVKLEELILRIKTNFKGSEAEVKKAVNVQKSSFPKGIPACGTDALRFTLCSHNAKVHFMSFDINECILNRNFCNKIWQATRYVLGSLTEADVALTPHELKNLNLSLMDKWILSRLADTVTNVQSAFETETLHYATSAIKDFIYYNFCDVYLEASKVLLKESATAVQSRYVLISCVSTFIHLLAPVMPFLSEQLYQHLPHQTLNSSIHKNVFPAAADWAILKNSEAEREAEGLIETASAIREVRERCKLNKAESNVIIATQEPDLYEQYLNVMLWLGRCAEIKVCKDIDSHVKVVKKDVNPMTTVYVVGEAVDLDVTKKLKKMIKEEESLTKTISTKKFLHQTLEAQETKRKKLEEIRFQITKLTSQS